MSLVQRLLWAIDAKSPERVADLVVAATEKERRAARGPLHERLPRMFSARDDPGRSRAALVARLGTSTTRELRRSFHATWHGVPVGPAVAVLDARPAQIRRGVLKATSTDVFMQWLWPVAFEFVRRGDLERPDDAGWAAGAVGYVFGRSWWFRPADGSWDEDAWTTTVLGRLRDPAIADELLAAFEHEEPCVGLSSHADRVLERLVVAAVEDGSIERNRLLDLCLNGHLRDFRPTATRFFARLWDELTPTLPELVERQDLVIRVGTGDDPGGQYLALAALGALRKGGTDLDRAGTAAVSEAALAGTTKKLATRALRLLGRLATDAADVAVPAAVAGLGHPRADVQEATLAFLEQHLPELGDPRAVREQLLGWSGSVEPQLRSRVAALCGMDLPAQPQPAPTLGDLHERIAALPPTVVAAVGLDGVRLDPPELPAPLRFDPWEAPVLGAGRRIEPIGDAAELAEAMIAWLAGTVDGIDAERLIDGLARLGAGTTDAAAGSAVRTHVERLRRQFGETSESWPMYWLPAAWLDRQRPPDLPFLSRRPRLLGRRQLLGDLVTPPPPQHPRHHWLGLQAFDGLTFPAHPAAFGTVRMWEVAHHLATGTARPLLATPTHLGGWIDPAVLADRLEDMAQRKLVPDRFDAVQAVLRLAPVAGDDLTERLARLGTDPARAAVVVLGGEERVRDEGLRRATRLRADLGAAVHTRRPATRPGGVDHHALRWPGAHPGDGHRRDDPAGVALAALASPPDEIRWWNGANAILAGPSRTEMSGAVTALPRLPDLYGAAVATTVAFDLNANRSSDADHVALAALVDADVPLGEGAHTGVVVGLAARNEALATTAVDVAAAAAEDGRLDPGLLGRTLANVVNGGLTSLLRPAGRLATVAEQSPLHADVVRRTVIAILASLEGSPHGLHAALETLLAAATQCGRGVDDQAARTFLEGGASGGSKRARLARSLLELPQQWDDRTPELIAIAGRLDRAERWAASATSVTPHYSHLPRGAGPR